MVSFFVSLQSLMFCNAFVSQIAKSYQKIWTLFLLKFAAFNKKWEFFILISIFSYPKYQLMAECLHTPCMWEMALFQCYRLIITVITAGADCLQIRDARQTRQWCTVSVTTTSHNKDAHKLVLGELHRVLMMSSSAHFFIVVSWCCGWSPAFLMTYNCPGNGRTAFISINIS